MLMKALCPVRLTKKSEEVATFGLIKDGILFAVLCLTTRLCCGIFSSNMKSSSNGFYVPAPHNRTS
jgi:hypothetical protein